ncbi:hypothetical protein AMTRI_Chr10g3650 [Amborella trichopoda]|uniref:Uncharacterized protein n=1 Tax=Amborella trichopoda TaxID=13333 RepID=W1NZH8_AMBTC|nr:uncharacterized protein LOC18428151 [Amborella trichopoda]ERN00110.1 hypothetical protein AMTR_s00112p00080160 [Amborella trichopoda]|eukprot:XP_006837256.1 uncharacterized protein LOC18428151 [Amborella trichopoda]
MEGISSSFSVEERSENEEWVGPRLSFSCDAGGVDPGGETEGWESPSHSPSFRHGEGRRERQVCQSYCHSLSSPGRGRRERGGRQSPRRSLSYNPNSASPEFEFWMVRNPAFPPSHLSSADELFLDGVLLPLHLLTLEAEPDPDSEPETKTQLGAQPDFASNLETQLQPELDSKPKPAAHLESEANHEPQPGSASDLTVAVTPSKRWTDIFKMGEKKTDTKEKKKGKKSERRKSLSSSSSELNIHIWPFSRSRSAGNEDRRREAGPTRNAVSAPCSRSNSKGESGANDRPVGPKSAGPRAIGQRPKKGYMGLGTSPSRGSTGVHLGRNSPVRPLLRRSVNGSSGVKIREKIIEGQRSDSSIKFGGERTSCYSGRARVLNVNVPLCMGMGSQLQSRSRCNGESNAGNGGNGFSFRALFTKKVVY